MKGLVVTADDFGAAREINDAVEIAHRDGVLTAASLMIGAPEAADAVERAKRMASLRVGLHLVLTEGRPLLPAAELPDLVDEDGRFRSGMVRSGLRIFLSPQAKAQVAKEIAAQFEAFRATGLSLDHCNAHNHFHLHPTVGSLMVHIGRRFGLRAARIPREPRGVLAKVEPQGWSAPDWLTGPWSRRLGRLFREAGISSPDHVFGLRWSGQMTRDRLAGLIRNLPDGLSEIYLHPATNGGFPGAAPGYRYADELAALTAPEVKDAMRGPALRRGGFTDFLGAGDGVTLAHDSPNKTPSFRSLL